MSTEVRVSYDWTLAEIRCVMRLYPRPFWVWGDWKSCGLILVLGIIVGFSIQQVWLSQDIGYPETVTLVLTLPYLAACFMLVRVGFSRSSPTGAKGHPDLNHPIRYTITDEHWVCETNTFRSESQWLNHIAVLRRDEGFMILTHDHQMAWLPISGFESDAAVEAFVQMVESHEVKYEDRRRA